MTGKERIEKLLEKLFPICEKWIVKKNGNVFYEDPLDGEEISAHYGSTHMAAALIIYGKMKRQRNIYDKGFLLIKSID